MNNLSDQIKLLKYLSNIKSHNVFLKLTNEEFMFLSQVFLHFLKAYYPVPLIYRNRLKPHAEIIRKFARTKTVNAAKKIKNVFLDGV